MKLPLADEPDDLNGPKWTGEISLLIGAMDAVRILTGKTHRISESILAIETIFGWVVFGGMDNDEKGKITTTLISQANSWIFQSDDEDEALMMKRCYSQIHRS